MQSKYFAVGSVVPHAQANAGAVATQARGNVTYGPRGLEMLRQGMAPEAVLKRLIEDDPSSEHRQVGIVDGEGRSATFTGGECLPWAGGRTGEHYAVQGNLLSGPRVVDAMAETFETATKNAEGDLAARLLAALRAGQAAGGDLRGRQSAALLVVREGAGYMGANDRLIDLHVEDHETPIAELERLLRLRRGQIVWLEAWGRLGEARETSDGKARAKLLGQALENARRAVALSPRNAGAWLTLAQIRLEKNDLDAAAEAAAKALALNPKLKGAPAKTRDGLGLGPATLERLLADKAFRATWEALPDAAPAR